MKNSECQQRLTPYMLRSPKPNTKIIGYVIRWMFDTFKLQTRRCKPSISKMPLARIRNERPLHNILGYEMEVDVEVEVEV